MISHNHIEIQFQAAGDRHHLLEDVNRHQEFSVLNRHVRADNRVQVARQDAWPSGLEIIVAVD